MASVQNPNVQSHMQVKGEVFDKNRGSDHGGNNSPKMKEGY